MMLVCSKSCNSLNVVNTQYIYINIHIQRHNFKYTILKDTCVLMCATLCTCRRPTMSWYPVRSFANSLSSSGPKVSTTEPWITTSSTTILTKPSFWEKNSYLESLWQRVKYLPGVAISWRRKAKEEKVGKLSWQQHLYSEQCFSETWWRKAYPSPTTCQQK